MALFPFEAVISWLATATGNEMYFVSSELHLPNIPPFFFFETVFIYSVFRKRHTIKNVIAECPVKYSRLVSFGDAT